MVDLGGKAVFLTGGVRRLGRQLAHTFMEAGADVTLTSRAPSAEGFALAERLSRTGRRVQLVGCDVTDAGSVRAAVEQAVAYHGRLDVVVNNAGVFQQARLDDITVEAWDEVFATNVRGPFLVSQAALPHLRRTHGNIVNIGSLGGLRPWATHAHYCSSKAALHMLTQTMAKALAPEVRVNCVAPGWIEMPEDDPAMVARFRERTPLGRNPTPAEIAEAVLMLAGTTSPLTGQILVVDGGLSLRA